MYNNKPTHNSHSNVSNYISTSFRSFYFNSPGMTLSNMNRPTFAAQNSRASYPSVIRTNVKKKRNNGDRM